MLKKYQKNVKKNNKGPFTSNFIIVIIIVIIIRTRGRTIIIYIHKYILNRLLTLFLIYLEIY
jgi:hypothetical protein